MKTVRNLAVLACVLAFVVITLGAWTRLSDAGLGCPDWPTCYGHILVPDEAHELQKAQELFPAQTVVAAKAWPEMIHRYFASTLGLLIIAIAVLAYRQRRAEQGQDVPFTLALALVVLVCVQGAFGAWTVTMKLMPIVVTTHLLLGMTTFSLLVVLAMRSHGVQLSAPRSLQRWAVLSLVVVFMQIALGGWTSANYAALACTELPICQGDWWQNAEFSPAFALHIADRNYEFGVLDYSAQVAIHVLHRFGAIAVLLALGALIVQLLKTGQKSLRVIALALGALLTLQIALGVINVIGQIPLFNAVAHNAVGALLLASMIAINVLLWRGQRASATHTVASPTPGMAA